MEEYKKHRTEELHASVMQIIVKANPERHGESMCQAMEELLEPRIRERERISEERGETRGISISEVRGYLRYLLKTTKEKLSMEEILGQIQSEYDMPEEEVGKIIADFGVWA